MRYKFFFIPFLLVIICVTAVNAQRAEVGINAGGAGYMGDLNQDNPLKISGISAGAFARLNFDPHWGIGLHYTYGSIKADDKKSDNAHFNQRNLNFKSNLHEISILGNLNFIDISSPIAKKRFTPYIYAGIGGVIFDPKGYYQGKWQVPLRAFNSESRTKIYRDYAIVIIAVAQRGGLPTAILLGRFA